MVLPERQPGGWSARGQPCDAIHALLRKNMNTYLETCLGYRSGLMSRATETPVLMSNGNVHLAVSHEDSVLSCIYGWQRMAKQQKVLRQGVGNKNRIPLLMWFDLHLYTLYIHYRHTICIYEWLHIIYRHTIYRTPIAHLV